MLFKFALNKLKDRQVIFKKPSGFTLIEILLYFGLFFLIIAIVYPIITQVLVNYSALKGQIDLGLEVKNIFLRIQREIFRSKSMNILTDWEIVFGQQNEQVAFFQTQPVYLENNFLKGYANNLSIGSISFFGENYYVSATNSNSCDINSTTTVSSIYSFSGYAWSPNLGWLKFRNDPGEEIFGVCLDNNNELRGFAWNDVVGYISFNCLDLSVCDVSNYKVVFKDNYFSGFAWNEILGWLIFDGKAKKVYLAKMNPNVYYLELVSSPAVDIEELKFTKIYNALKVNLKIKGLGNTYEENETAIVLPF